MLENNILFLKDHLEKLKNDKFKEIDDYFDNINRNMIILKKNFDETKSNIENYYNRYNKFFNIKYVNENINISEQNKQVMFAVLHVKSWVLLIIDSLSYIVLLSFVLSLPFVISKICGLPLLLNN